MLDIYKELYIECTWSKNGNATKDREPNSEKQHRVRRVEVAVEEGSRGKCL